MLLRTRLGQALFALGLVVCLILLPLTPTAQRDNTIARGQGVGELDDPQSPTEAADREIDLQNEPNHHFPQHHHRHDVVKETIPGGTIDGSDGQMVIIYLLVGIVAFLVMVAFL